MDAFRLRGKVFLADGVMLPPLVGEEVFPDKVLLNFDQDGLVYRI